jgi:hypothetical protein
MAISNINSASQPSTVNSITSGNPAAAANRARATTDRQEATVVTLSAQARRLSLTQTEQPQELPQTNELRGSPQAVQTQASQTQFSERTNSAAAEKVQIGAREAAEAVASRPTENEPRIRRINTYA